MGTIKIPATSKSRSQNFILKSYHHNLLRRISEMAALLDSHSCAPELVESHARETGIHLQDCKLAQWCRQRRDRPRLFPRAVFDQLFYFFKRDCYLSQIKENDATILSYAAVDGKVKDRL